MRIPRITPRKIIRILKRKGFRLVRQSGSHMIFRNAEGVRVTVPYHSGKILHPKLLRRIMEDAEIDAEEL